MATKKTPSEKGAEAVEDRQDKYGHPADVYARVAYMWTGILLHKLKDAEFIEPHEVGLMQAALKIGREAENPGVVPDNLDDLSGYADVVAMIHERRPPSHAT